MSSKENGGTSSPAAQLMAIEVLTELLVSTSPQELCEALTNYLRELTGAKTVMVLAHKPEPELDGLLHITPLRRAELLSPIELNYFCFDKTPGELPYSPDLLPEHHPLKAILVSAGIQSMARYSLHAGGEAVGLLLMFDLPGVERIGETNLIISRIAPPIALALKNSLAFFKIEQLAQELERRVDEQTAELRHAQALLRAAMDCSPAGIAIADAPDGMLRYVNDAGLLMFGADRQNIVNGVGIEEYVKSWNLFGLDGRQLRIEEVPLARTIMFGEANSRELVIRNSEDYDRIVLANAAPVRDGSGKIQAGIMVFADITESKKTEMQMQSLTERLQLATSSGHLGVWDWNVRDNKMVWDDRMFVLYGITREIFPNSFDAWMNGLHPDDKEVAIAESRAALNGEKEFDTEFRVLHPDGTVKYIRGKGIVIRGTDGTAERMIGINYDVTDTKNAAVEKRKLEDQLQQAQKMESVGRLAGGVAHDFNNMLTVILGHAQLGLMHLDATHPVCADLKEISKTAERSADLTRQLLAFARKQTVVPKVLDLNTAVTEMLKMLQRLIGEDICLRWQPSSELWHVRMDPSQIDQILANLCVNARDAIDGTGSITIETENRTIDTEYCLNNLEATPGEYVCVTVSDSGSGMDKETLTHIFEPFYTTKGLGKGTGLGLSTVYGAVKQNGGFINVYSEPGQETTFSIYLPRDVSSRNNQALAGTAVTPTPRGQETILLVEDEPAILNITAIMLENQGYTVLKAETPGEAARLAREHVGEIQLLMTDVIMPEMNGRDLAKNLLSIYPNMRRLFMSGYTADVIANHGVLEDGVHFMQKPFSLPDMAAKVREALDSN